METETKQDSTDAEPTAESTEAKPKLQRGFAVMDIAKRREIASKGGKASHALGTGHEWNKEAARAAGRKGGLMSRGGRGNIAK